MNMLKLGRNSETPDTQAFADDLASADASPEQEARPKPTRTGRGLPLRERKVYRNLARYTPRVQGLTFDHNQIRWISYWKNEQNKQVQKHFPVSRFGFFGARLMALEERNRIQGWPLFADEAFHLIEGLKIFVKSNPEYAAALLQGGELDPVTGDIHLNVYAEQVLESCSATLEERIAASLATGLRALPPQIDAGGRNQRSKPTTAAAVSTRQPPPPPLSQDDDDCSVQRRASVGVATRRQRAARLKTASRRNGVTSNPAERRAAAPTQIGGSGGQEEITLPLPAFEKKGEFQQSTDSGMATYADVLAQAYALSMGGLKVDATTTHQLSLPRSSQEEHLPPPNRDCRKPKVLPALLPAASGTVYLEGGGDSSVSSRLVSMASSSYEDSEPLVDSCGLVEQEPDALRDLLNCDVSEPMDTGVDWEVEGSNTATIVDVSRPTRNPLTRQSRQF